MNQQRVKVEVQVSESDLPTSVGSTVTIGVESVAEMMPSQRLVSSQPMVIAPIAHSSAANDSFGAGNVLQALLSLLQNTNATSQLNLNISDYISALVTQATIQKEATVVSRTPTIQSALASALSSSGTSSLSSLLTASSSSAPSLPSLGNAIEGFFSLAPALAPSGPRPQAVTVSVAPEPIKMEHVTTLQTLANVPTETSYAQGAEGGADCCFENPDSPGASDDGSVVKKRRFVSRSRDSKIDCLVCGDRALGCNFDAVSCESCKAFFRRNALKEKKGSCLFEGNCKIDVNTRRFCPHCRLEKCFAVGMKKEFILSEEAKRKRSQKKGTVKSEPVETDALSPQSSFISAPATPVAPATPAPVAPVSVAPSVSLVSAAPNAVQINAPLALNTSVNHTARLMPASGIQAVINNLSTPQVSTIPFPPPTQITLEIPAGSTESVNLLSLSRFVKTTENFNVPMDSYLVRRLTLEESQMLQELMQIYDLSFTVDIEPLVHITQADPSLNQLVNQSSITVLRIIKFAKRLEEFVRLPQECQIGILKGCWIHMLLLRSVSAYDNERDLWVTPRGEIPTAILKNATGFDRLHDDHVRYCKSIRSIIKDDLTIVVLLIVTALFAPEGPHVITRELVSNIQDKYLVLLKHYLESKYMYGRAAEMFPQLMSKMKELKELAEDHGKYLLDVNPNEIEPIMLEILDLK